ncbi:SgcJ/EcaC family oxidoreductase [bacterium SCSIO 12696]|nr:SgcJ/EcaC family oxidoreductase [bacterium SCSIO 12696]
MGDNEIVLLFDEWNSALQTGNPEKVVPFYDAEAILLPTISDKVRHNHKEIQDYFVDFLKMGPKGKIDESNVRTFGQIAIHSGVYTFTFNNATTAQARFSFVYRWNGKRWMIVEHHSSRMPESQ